jgi:hypothetical protein
MLFFNLFGLVRLCYYLLSPSFGLHVVNILFSHAHMPDVLSVDCIKQDGVYRLDAFPCVFVETVSCYINFEESGQLG